MLPVSAIASALLPLALSSLAVASAPVASVAAAQGYTVSEWTADSLHSSVLDETRRISVALPVGYDFRAMATFRYPVLIILDEAYGSPQLGAKIITARQLSFMQGWLLPPMIIVSVEGGRTRVRDMTPPPIPGQPSLEPGRGGAPAFATFIADELLPWLADRYRTSPYTVLQGHSINGLFAAWVYGYRPDKINAVLALSPTIVWSDDAYQQVLSGIRNRRQPGRFFMAASEVEGTMIPGKTRQLLTDLANEGGPATTVLHQWYTDVSHGQTDLLGYLDGLRAVFRPVGLAGIDASMTFPEVYRSEFARRRDAYRAAAPDFALPSALPLFFMMNQVLTLGTTEDYRDLREVVPTLCEELRSSYPGSWAVPVCDGHVRINARDLDAAEAAFGQALQIAEREGDAIGANVARQGTARVAQARRGSRAPH